MQLGPVSLGRTGANMRDRLRAARCASRQPNSPAMRSVAAWGRQFGGHVVQAAGPDQSL